MKIEFVDTNVFVYAYSAPTDARHQPAKELVTRLWVDRTGAISTQILGELFVTLTRKVQPNISHEIARERVAALSAWPVFRPSEQSVLEAIDCHHRYQISYWDALIVVAARHSKARILWSEDLSSGQDYAGVELRNPFSEWG